MIGVMAVLDVESFLLGIAAGGGGGGNPNYVETIEGTLANPWGGKFEEIITGCKNKNLTAFISLTSSEGMNALCDSEMYLQKSDASTSYEWGEEGYCFNNASYMIFMPFDTLNAGNCVAVCILYDTDGNYHGAVMYNNGPKEVSRNSSLNYTTLLTIIHHPMP